MRCAASKYVCETLQSRDKAVGREIGRNCVALIMVLEGTWKITTAQHSIRVSIKRDFAEPIAYEIHAAHSVNISGAGILAYVYAPSMQLMDAVREAEVSITEKPWGCELNVESESHLAMLKFLEVHAGNRTSLHYHEHKVETMMFLGQQPEEVMHVEAGVHHRIAGPRKYFEASTHHPDDVVRVEDDHGR